MLNGTFCPFLSVLVSVVQSASVDRFSVLCMRNKKKLKKMLASQSHINNKVPNIRNGASCHKIHYFAQVKSIPNLKVNQNCIVCEKLLVNFAEGVDFAYWWSCITNGLRL